MPRPDSLVNFHPQRTRPGRSAPHAAYNPLVTDEDRARGVCTPCHQPAHDDTHAEICAPGGARDRTSPRKKHGMSNLVYLRGELVNTTTHYAELLDLYENRHRYSRDNRMPLTCPQTTRRPDAPTPHQRRDYGPPTTPAKAPAASVISREPESPQHQNLKDYAADACDAWPVTPEYSTGNGTIVDLFVDAPFQFGVEAQFSTLSSPRRQMADNEVNARRCPAAVAALRRTTLAVRCADDPAQR